jgi:hypothetical protein
MKMMVESTPLHQKHGVCLFCFIGKRSIYKADPNGVRVGFESRNTRLSWIY